MAKAGFSSSPKGGSKDQPPDLEKFTLLGALREIRARAQILREIALAIQQQEVAASTLGVADSAFESILQSRSSLIESNSGCISRVLRDIYALIEKRGDIYSSSSDEMAKIDSVWLQSINCWHMLAAAGKEDRSQIIVELIGTLDSVIYGCTLISIPSRILRHLEPMPIGSVINFNEAYGNEFSSPEQRQRLLRYLELYPGVFETGLVDVKNERIVRVAPRGWRRSLTIWVTAGLALLGFGWILLACHMNRFIETTDEWPFKAGTCGAFLSSYLFILIGSVAHIFVTLLKQDRSASESNQSLAAWILRIHVRETSFYLAAISFWLAPFALAFVPGLQKAGWALAFFLGYSYDSFVDLFLQRFDKVVASGKDAVTKAMSVK